MYRRSPEFGFDVDWGLSGSPGWDRRRELACDPAPALPGACDVAGLRSGVMPEKDFRRDREWVWRSAEIAGLLAGTRSTASPRDLPALIAIHTSHAGKAHDEDVLPLRLKRD